MDKSYIIKFQDKYKEFINFILIDDIYNKINDNSLKNEINKYYKLINTLDYIKLAYFYHTNTITLKEHILRHNNDIFLQSKVLIPKIDISKIYDVIKDTLYINQLWDLLAEMKVLSDIIIEPLIKEKEKRKNNKEITEDLTTLNNMSIDEIEDKIKNFSISASKDISVSSLINKDSVENDYKESALLNFVKNLDVENASIMDVVLNVVKKVDITEQLNNIDDDTIKEISGVVNNFFGTDSNMDNMVKDIADTLKHTNLQEGKLEDNLQNIASDITNKMLKNNNEEDLRNLAGKAKDIMKDYDANKDMMSNVETILKSKFGKSFNSMGMNKKDIEQMLKSYGIGNGRLNGMNSRKIQRMAQHQTQSNNNKNKSHTQASVNARQQALKAKYEKNKQKKQNDNKNDKK